MKEMWEVWHPLKDDAFRRGVYGRIDTTLLFTRALCYDSSFSDKACQRLDAHYSQMYRSI